MNAPDFNFGPERRERGLTVVGDRRDLVIGTYPTAGAAPAEPDGPNLRDQFFKILGLALKHRWLVLACCVGGLVIGFLVTFTSTPIFRATATIQVDLAAAKVVKLDTPDSSPQVDSFRFYQTQRELLQSRSLAERVASNLDLGDGGFVNPRPTSSWAKLKRIIFPDKPGEKLDLAQRKAAAAGLIQAGLSCFSGPEFQSCEHFIRQPRSGMGGKHCKRRGARLHRLEFRAALRLVRLLAQVSRGKIGGT